MKDRHVTRTLFALVIFFLGISVRMYSHQRQGFAWEFAAEVGTFLAVTVCVAFVYEQFIKPSEAVRLKEEIGQVIRKEMRDLRISSGSSAASDVVYEEGRLPMERKLEAMMRAKIEIVEVGSALRTFVSYFEQHPSPAFANPIRDLLSSGVELRCFLVDPDFSENMLNDKALADRARMSIASLRGIRDRMAAHDPTIKFEIFCYRELPTVGAILIDPGEQHGSVLISPYMFAMKRSDAPTFILSGAQHTAAMNRLATEIGGLKSRSTSV